MDDAERLIWTGIGGLTVALLGGAIRFITRHIAEKKLDRVLLSSELSASADADALHKLGCPQSVKGESRKTFP